MVYPTPHDTLPMGFAGETATHGALVDGHPTTSGVQAQRDPDGRWRTVDVVVALGWEDSASGQSRLVAYGAAR